MVSVGVEVVLLNVIAVVYYVKDLAEILVEIDCLIY